MGHLQKKRYFVEKIPILGEGGKGGLPTWEFFPHNTVFSEDVPKEPFLQPFLNSTKLIYFRTNTTNQLKPNMACEREIFGAKFNEKEKISDKHCLRQDLSYQIGCFLHPFYFLFSPSPPQSPSPLPNYVSDLGKGAK